MCKRFIEFVGLSVLSSLIAGTNTGFRDTETLKREAEAFLAKVIRKVYLSSHRSLLGEG